MKIDIIIPVFGRDAALATVCFLREQSYADDLKYIVIDNGNDSGLSARLKSLEADDCGVIRLEKNAGGAGAYRAGMAAAVSGDADYVWLLDDDAEINEKTLPALISAHRELASQGIAVGTVGSMTVSDVRRNRVTELGANVSRVSGCIQPRYAGVAIEKIGKRLIEVDYVAACSLLVSRKTLMEAGPFEQVFIHWDDIEWQFRLKRLGYRNFATSESYVHHPEAAAKRKDWVWYYDLRNSIWFLKDYMPWALPASVFLKTGRMCVYLLRGRLCAVRMMLLGILHAFSGQLLMRDELQV